MIPDSGLLFLGHHLRDLHFLQISFFKPNPLKKNVGPITNPTHQTRGSTQPIKPAGQPNPRTTLLCIFAS